MKICKILFILAIINLNLSCGVIKKIISPALNAAKNLLKTNSQFGFSINQLMPINIINNKAYFNKIDNYNNKIKEIEILVDQINLLTTSLKNKDYANQEEKNNLKERIFYQSNRINNIQEDIEKQKKQIKEFGSIYGLGKIDSVFGHFVFKKYYEYNNIQDFSNDTRKELINVNKFEKLLYKYLGNKIKKEIDEKNIDKLSANELERIFDNINFILSKEKEIIKQDLEYSSGIYSWDVEKIEYKIVELSTKNK